MLTRTPDASHLTRLTCMRTQGALRCCVRREEGISTNKSQKLTWPLPCFARPLFLLFLVIVQDRSLRSRLKRLQMGLAVGGLDLNGWLSDTSDIQS